MFVVHMINTDGKQSIILTLPITPGPGSGAQRELRPAGAAGRTGAAAEPRARGLQDLLCGPEERGGGPAEGVSALLLQVLREHVL